MADEKPGQKQFQADPIGDSPLDSAAVRTAEGKRSLFVAIDRTCKLASAELHAEANELVATPFLRNVSAAIPDKIHTVLTDNGLQFTHRTRERDAFHPIFERVGQASGIDQRLTKTHQPWTNGQVERMNRTLTEATVRKYDDATHGHLKAHLYALLMASNFAQRLTSRKGLTPYEYICHCWHKEPERFAINPYHHTLGLNT